jgi:hypothetical protein
VKSVWALLLGIVFARVVLTVLCHFSGVTAISDDDFARVAIAQGFAEHPALDPSGTSWLPAPFWVMGGAMHWLAPSLMLARLVSLALAVLAALGLYVVGLWQGLGRQMAAVVAFVATFLPQAVLLGVGTIPDYPTAVLILLGAASLARRDGSLRLLGAAALLGATLSRYEAWPVAAVFATFCLWDWLRQTLVRDAENDLSPWALVGAGLLSMAGPLSWLAHGLARHGDPWFFFGRVAAYHRALGGTTVGWLDALLSQLGALLFEPETLVAIALLLGLTLVLRRHHLSALQNWGRLASCLLALLAFRIISEHTGGVPTHHAERTLLSLWLALLVFGGALGRSVLDAFAEPRRLPVALGIVGLLAVSTALSALLLRPLLPPRELQSRSTEVVMGRLAQGLVHDGDRLAICTTDYGSFAIQAAFGRPKHTVNICDHDPRHPKKSNPLESREALVGALHEKSVKYLIAPLEALHPRDRGLNVVAVRDHLVLVKAP